MRFVDRAKVYVRSGDGGDGCMSFYRDRSNPVGYADGGDGGDGGDIVFQVDPGLNTLIDLVYHPHLKAKKGKHGSSQNRKGSKGQDAVIQVPQGTQVFEDERLVIDLTQKGQRVCLVHGGRGGKGNVHLKTSENRRPRERTLGEKGSERVFVLCLKTLADVGLVGLPNVGKSTFLSACTQARPKIADYPFTTLTPNLGVVDLKGDKIFVVADIPGLHAQADEKKGLNPRFLGHIERTRLLLHLIDITSQDLLESYRNVRRALSVYGLGQKPEIIVLNKRDRLSVGKVRERQRVLERDLGRQVEVVSALNPSTLLPLLERTWSLLAQ